MNILPENVIKNMYSEVANMKKQGFEVGIIGKTVLGNPIPYVKKGNARYGKAMIFGAIHAREYITTPLVLKMAEEYKGKSAIYFVPLVNVDGVALATLGIDFINRSGYKKSEKFIKIHTENGKRNAENDNKFFPFSEKSIKIHTENGKRNAENNRFSALSERLIEINNYNTDFSLWKANINAVDLNVNFDADFGAGIQNLRYPAPANYIGPVPESEPETKALINFTKIYDFSCVLCYHCKGEVIYYGYKNNAPAPELAAQISKSTGYPLAESVGSAGGYKDWFTEQFDKPAFTVEVGNEKLSYAELNGRFDEIYRQNAGLTEIIDAYSVGQSAFK
jgi:g-D-glutamyl-meso-diaminopimelate peptidase